MKIKTVVLICLVLLLFTGCNSKKMPSNNDTIKSDYIFENDNSIFYKDFYKGNLYKLSLGEKFPELIIKDTYEYLIDQQTIYYVNGKDFKIYKLSLKGGESKVIKDSRSVDLVLDGGFLYYINQDKGNRLAKVELAGLKETFISDIPIHEYKISNGWIFFSNAADDGKLYKMKTNGDSVTKLNDSPYSLDINYKDGWIYCTCYQGLVKIDANGHNLKILSDRSFIKEAKLEGDWIYFDIAVEGIEDDNEIQKLNDQSIFKISIDGKNETLLGKNSLLLSVQKKWLYSVKFPKGELYRTNLDTSETQKIAQSEIESR